MICGYDVVEQFAIALPYIARNKKIQRNVRALKPKPIVKRTSLLCSSAPLPTTSKIPKAKSQTRGKSPTPKTKRQKPNAAAQREKLKTKDKSPT